MLPIGMSKDLSNARVKVYCPKCKDVYIPIMRFIDIKRAYFGCFSPHIFLKTFPGFIPKEKPNLFVPKIYGFGVFGKKGLNIEENISIMIMKLLKLIMLKMKKGWRS